MYGQFGPPTCSPRWARRRAHFGPPMWAACGGARPSREEWLSSLEEHQKDLEQEVADVADLIRRLREDPDEPEAASP
jgi:hypothetical protein